MQSVILIVGGIILLFAGAVMCRRWGYYSLFGVLPLLGAIIWVSRSYHDLLVFLAAALIIGCVSGLALRYAHTMQYLLIASSCMITLVGSGHYYYFLFAKKVDIVTDMRNQAKIQIQKAASSSAYNSEVMVGQVDEVFSMIKKAFPFYYVLLGTLWTLLGFVIVKFPLRKWSWLFPGIDRFRLNDYCIVPLIAAIGIFAVTMHKHGVVNMVALNVLLVLGFFYLIQGMGIVKYFLLMKGLPTVLLPALVLGVLIIGQLEIAVVASICFAGFGALDLWADFRGFTKKSTPSGDDLD